MGPEAKGQSGARFASFMDAALEEARAALRNVTRESDKEAIVLVARMTALYYTHLLYP